MASLEIIAGSKPGEYYELTGDQTFIGRAAACDLVLSLHTISRRHSRITCSDGTYFIEDLDSLNGTFVDGNRIEEPTLLQDQDVIQIFDVVILFHEHSVLRRSTAKSIDDSTNSEHALRLVQDDSRNPLAPREIVPASNVASDSNVIVAADVKLRAVLEIARNLGSSLDVDEVLPKVLDNLFGVFPQADRGYILIVEEETGELVPRALKGRNELDTFGPISQTIANRVMSQREAILSADVSDDESLSGSDSIFELGIRSMMCAPLMGPSHVPVGIIHIETNDPAMCFERDDLDVLVTVATVAGQAVEYARTHEDRLELDRQEREMAMARDMQLHFLPQRQPSLPNYQFFHFYRAAEEVGGDYFGYIPLPDGRLAIALGDVSGKGVPAALLMARLCSDTRACLIDAATPAEGVARLNNEVLEPILGGRFVTFVLCVLDPIRHEVTIVNAGHPSPLLRRAASGEVFALGEAEKGMPLGFGMRDLDSQCTVPLEPGDTVLMYTDGVSEAQNADRELYGTQRIVQRLASSTVGAQQLGESLLADVEQFVNNWPQSDDMCLLCFGRTSD